MAVVSVVRCRCAYGRKYDCMRRLKRVAGHKILDHPMRKRHRLTVPLLVCLFAGQITHRSRSSRIRSANMGYWSARPPNQYAVCRYRARHAARFMCPISKVVTVVTDSYSSAKLQKYGRQVIIRRRRANLIHWIFLCRSHQTCSPALARLSCRWLTPMMTAKLC